MPDDATPRPGVGAGPTRSEGAPALRLAVDIGGTFTDFALHDPAGGDIHTFKRLTDVADPAAGVVAGALELLSRVPGGAAGVGEILHATTLATNVVLERKGRPTGLVTTRGFRDILEIGRQKRYELYDFNAPKPRPVVEPWQVVEVDERVDAHGEVVTALDEESVRRAVAELGRLGVGTVAVCLLHSYRNPGHERRIREIVAEVDPGMLVTLSSDVAPMIREYERASTTTVSAYVRPEVAVYLGALTDLLAAAGVGGKLLIMQSSGGLVDVAGALDSPVRLIESGPAAGVLAAAAVGTRIGAPEVISFDMGGTTAKVCLVEGGVPAMANELEVDRAGLKDGSGLPLAIPAIDLVEIGAGGGSIAQVRMGVTAVGPESSGAAPGPACYGLGGDRPTVTDANLVLGYLNPEHFLGGGMALDAGAAHRAVHTHLARELGIGVPEAAWSVYEIVTTNMAQAANLVSVERGRDPRDFHLVAFGGAGPLHAAHLARRIGIRSVVLPRGAGVGSAVGLLNSDTRIDLARSLITPVDAKIADMAGEVWAGLAEQAGRVLAGLVGPERVLLECAADMRYVGQGYETEVALGGWPLVPASGAGRPGEGLDAEAVTRAFHTAYQEVYGYHTADHPVEVVTWRLRARDDSRRDQPTGQLSPTAAPTAGHPPQATPVQTRPAWFPGAGGFVPTAVHRRDSLVPGAVVTGPAIIEESESTTVVPPGDTCVADEFGNLRISIGEGGNLP